MVLDGSFALYNEFFETHENEKPATGWNLHDSHHYTLGQLDWFIERGCKWVKVEAGPGDVILWDSRTVHYGAEARGDRPRVATCKCFYPCVCCPPADHQTYATSLQGTQPPKHSSSAKRPSATRTTL